MKTLAQKYFRTIIFRKFDNIKEKPMQLMKRLDEYKPDLSSESRTVSMKPYTGTVIVKILVSSINPEILEDSGESENS